MSNLTDKVSSVSLDWIEISALVVEELRTMSRADAYRYLARWLTKAYNDGVEKCESLLNNGDI